MLRNLLTRFLEWLRAPIPCEGCRSPEATFRPNEEAYLCDRCAGSIR